MAKEKEVVETEEVVEKQLSIYGKIQSVREDMSRIEIKKGGRNKFAGYSYFELPDFLPQSNQLCAKHRITPVFNLNTEKATLDIYDYDSDAVVHFETPSADATTLNKQGMPSNLEIQSLGSQHTYLKRYLYMHFLELAENDGLEVNNGDKDLVPRDVNAPTIEPPKLATGYQLKEIEKLFTQNRINKMIKAYGVEQLKEMKQDDLEKIITIRKKQIKKEQDDKLEKEKPVVKVEELTEEDEMEIMSENIGALDDLV